MNMILYMILDVGCFILPTLFVPFNPELSHFDKSLYVWFDLAWFYGTSTIVGYLMQNPFYTYKQFYFKQFSLM